MLRITSACSRISKPLRALMIADAGRYGADPDRSTHTIIRKQQSYADDMKVIDAVKHV